MAFDKTRSAARVGRCAPAPCAWQRRAIVLLLGCAQGLVIGRPSSAAADAGSDALPALERISLEEAVARALANNPTTAVAAREIARADALVRQARAAALPTLSGNAAAIRLDRDRVTATGLKVADANQLTGNVTLTVPLLAPLAWTAVDRAKLGRDVVEASADDLRRQVAATVARAFLTVRLQHRQVEVALRARDTARAHHEFARARLAGGLGTSLDAVRAEQELRSDEAQVARARAGLARAQAALGAAVSAEAPLDAVEDVTLATPPTLGAAVDQARRERADLRVLERRQEAARRARRDVWSLYAPYLAASGQVFAQRGSAFQPAQGWQAQLLLTLPFFDGGSRGGVAAERDALESEARLQLESALRQVKNEVRTSFEVLLRADETLAAAREAARLAREAADLAGLAYRAGATTNLEVIDAERRARDAETDAALAEDGARQARLDVLLAAGRFP